MCTAVLEQPCQHSAVLRCKPRRTSLAFAGPGSSNLTKDMSYHLSFQLRVPWCEAWNKGEPILTKTQQFLSTCYLTSRGEVLSASVLLSPKEPTAAQPTEWATPAKVYFLAAVTDNPVFISAQWSQLGVLSPFSIALSYLTTLKKFLGHSMPQPS